MLSVNIVAELLTFAYIEACEALDLYNCRIKPIWAVKDVVFRDVNVALPYNDGADISYLTLDANNLEARMTGGMLLFGPNRKDVYNIAKWISDYSRKLVFMAPQNPRALATGRATPVVEDYYNFGLYMLETSDTIAFGDYVSTPDGRIGLILEGRSGRYLVEADPGSYTRFRITSYRDMYPREFKYAFGLELRAELVYYR